MLRSISRSISRSIPLAVLILLAGLLVACGGGNAPAADSAAQDAAGAADPAGVAPVSSRAGGSGAASSRQIEGGAADGPTVSAAGLTFELPADWQQQQPSSSMRAAQAAIPGAGGDGELTVFFFGPGGGGGVEANLERWIGQVEVGPEGGPFRDSFSSEGLTITWVEAAGTLKASGMGMGPSSPQAGSLLFGAVVEGPGGPWFFKATGPEATLDASRADFVAMLRSARAG